MTSKARVIVLTDMGADVDDQESLIRLLVYSNEIDIEGLIATTSTFMRETVHPELIEERVRAYIQVRPNLQVHAPGFPEGGRLLAGLRAGSRAYGMSGVGDGKDTDASRLIIEDVDRADSRPVWISIWGGAADLAQALWTVRATRSPANVDQFVSKIRVYSISDQDDAGPWVRSSFPKLFWIGSLKDVKQAGSATWLGMSAPLPGSDPAPVSKSWLKTNIQTKGPLGALYLTPKFLMEGDTPSFLQLIPNGLGVPAHPDWGSWGGRYVPVGGGSGSWREATDTVLGANGAAITNNQATLWRWRDAYQNDFAARMDWTITSRFAAANHPPLVKLNGEVGDRPVQITACAGRPVRLTAKGSVDPDGQALSYRWWWYREPGGDPAPSVVLSRAEGPDTTVVISPTQPGPAPSASPPVHIMLEATDSGTPALTRYRRALISLSPARGACRASRQGAGVG